MDEWSRKDEKTQRNKTTRICQSSMKLLRSLGIAADLSEVRRWISEKSTTSCCQGTQGRAGGRNSSSCLKNSLAKFSVASIRASRLADRPRTSRFSDRSPACVLGSMRSRQHGKRYAIDALRPGWPPAWIACECNQRSSSRGRSHPILRLFWKLLEVVFEVTLGSRRFHPSPQSRPNLRCTRSEPGKFQA